MKTILILGSTSQIAIALSRYCSNGNRLVISGRDQESMNSVADICRLNGALNVRTVLNNLGESIQPIININAEWPIDLIIDAASTISRKRDDEIAPKLIINSVRADVLMHITLLEELLDINKRYPDIIFISSVLSILETPNRKIYSLSKQYLEAYLNKIRNSNKSKNIFIVRIGKLVDVNLATKKTDLLAQQIWKSFLSNTMTKNFGIAGNLLIALNYINPMLVKCLIRAQRMIRKS